MNILVLCTGNSCRSQIAEGYLRHLLKEKAQVYSAGITTHGVNKNAIKCMSEDGIDISMHTSNHVDEYEHLKFEVVLTVCDNAREQCPYFPASTMQLHQNFSDPASAEGNDEEIMQVFHDVRKQIKAYCDNLSTELLKDQL